MRHKNVDIKYRGETYTIPDAHPAANCLPWHLDRPEFADLIASIRDDGYDSRKPVLIQKTTGLIISGRRRSLACIIVDAEPEVEEVDWSGEEIVAYVRRDELHRRNLTDGERVMAVTELNNLKNPGRPEKGSRDPISENSKSLGEIADEAGVSRETAKRAAKVKKQAPEIVTAVKEGKLKVNTAARAADLPKPARERIAASDDPAATAKEELAKADLETEAPADLDPVAQLSARAGQVNEMFRALCTELDRVNERIVGMKDVPEARWVTWDVCRDQIRQVRNSIYQATLKPDPYCGATGHVDGDPCSACKGFGHVPKRVANACPTREVAA